MGSRQPFTSRIFFLLAAALVVGLAGCGRDGLENIAPTPNITEAVSAEDKPIFPTKPTSSFAPTPIEETPPPNAVHDFSLLSQAQKDRLFSVSMQFTANTEEKGIEIAKGLGFAGEFSHPSNMCGPLAMGILRDAGLVSQYVDLHEFWNMDPRPSEDERLMELTFPQEDYLWYRTETPIDQFDFNEFPLFTGDFVYLYAGDAGTFEHILVVTRVDELGRAFTMTNYRNEDQEYLIEELMLYDPNNPGEGRFFYWTDRSNADTGITGFGGFQLWRPLNHISDPEPLETSLALAIDSILTDAGGDWNVVIKEVGGDVLYDRRGHITVHTASIAKVPLALLFFHTLEQRRLEITHEWLNHSGTGDRTYNQLLEAMLVKSEEDAAEILEEWVISWTSPKKVLSEWGFSQMSITPRRATPMEVVELFEGLYLGEWINSTSREMILDFLSQYTPNDDTRLGSLSDFLPDDSTIYNKRGSLADDRVIVADVALVVVGERSFVLAFFSQPDDSNETTFEKLDAAIGRAAAAFWEIYADQK
ncbi:MAG: class A beta-lactamase-related serine hydrolase [Anaerolineae bacterium]|nr:class A beta-lactamase-related serine hydrolase [Anaerolineae bacterium]